MRRRTFLQTSTGALVGSSLLGAGRSTLAAQKPAKQWRPADDNDHRQATQSITVGDVVATNGSTTVRNPAGSDASSEQIPADVRGIVTVGPRQADGSTWWWVAFESGVSGWVAGSNLGDATVTFLHDQRVGTTADLVIHTDHRLAAPDVWVAPDGSAGYTRAGPQQADGYTWWKVAFNAGHAGWCVEQYLDPAVLQPDVDPPASTLEVGQRVATTADLVIHTDHRLAAPDVWVAPAGSAGYARAGPVDADGYTWWKVAFNAGHAGWCVEDYLEDATGETGVDGVVPRDFDVETDLTRAVPVTGSEIDAAIRAERPDSPLIGLGDTFVAVQDDRTVDALYQAAHAIHESAWGTSHIARHKHNLYGWGAVDSSPYEGAMAFDSFADSVWYVMDQVKDLYLTPGNWRYNGPTLDGMNVYYATDDLWAEKIASHYRTLATNIKW